MTTRQTGGLLAPIRGCYRPAPKDAGFHFRSSLIALDSSQPLKRRFYYQLPLEGGFVLFYTQFIHSYIMFLLLLNLLLYGCLVKTHSTWAEY